MTTDRYTKAVLTIIAGALLYIGAMLSGQPASAQNLTPGSRMFIEPNRPQPVVVVGWGTVRSRRAGLREHRPGRHRRHAHRCHAPGRAAGDAAAAACRWRSSRAASRSPSRSA